jgi:hypothetical protein
METQDTVADSELIQDWATFAMKPWWTNEHVSLSYINEPFNDPDALRHWRELGYTGRMTGDMYDMRQPEPDWVKHFRACTSTLEHFSWSVYRMMPGDVLPPHRDTYLNFKKIYNVQGNQNIRRYIVFLEPWQSGHYFEIEGQPLVGWARGACAYWHNDAEHAAGNFGTTPRYTLQITGVCKIDDPIFELGSDGYYPNSKRVG